MTEDIIVTIIAGIPNFSGFLIGLFIMYKIMDRQLVVLEKVVEDCIKDN